MLSLIPTSALPDWITSYESYLTVTCREEKYKIQLIVWHNTSLFFWTLRIKVDFFYNRVFCVYFIHNDLIELSYWNILWHNPKRIPYFLIITLRKWKGYGYTEVCKCKYKLIFKPIIISQQNNSNEKTVFYNVRRFAFQIYSNLFEF